MPICLFLMDGHNCFEPICLVGGWYDYTTHSIFELKIKFIL
jgi:hypothetical protein